MPGRLALFVLIAVPAVLNALETGPTYRRLEGSAAVSASYGTPEAAAEGAKESFDEPIDPSVFRRPSPRPEVQTPEPARLDAPSGDFVVGKPQRYSEPNNPLQEDDQPKEKSSRWLWKVAGAAIGGILAGILGFFVGGPVGAGIGFVAGAVGGWMVTH